MPLSKPAAPVRGYIAGLTLSNDGGTPNTILDIAVGAAADSTGVVTMVLGSAFTKSTGGAWAVGSGSNGMGNGLTIANATWYHVFLILNGGSVDVYFDTSVTAANKPTGTTYFRRIGSFLTNGSAAILGFKQDGECFYWSSGTYLDANVSASTAYNPRASVTLTVPLGVKVRPMLRCSCSSLYLQLTSLDMIGTEVPGASDNTLQDTTSSSNLHMNAQANLYTNTSSQIGALTTSSATSFKIRTLGWVDDRGKFD